MKIKILALGLVCFFLSSLSLAEEKFGFTGEMYQISLKDFPISFTEKFEVEDEIEYGPMDSAALPVKALMIGVSKWEPDDPDFESFYFYAYHFPGFSEWWVGFIVVNYGDSTVPCNITMLVKGPKKSKITRKAVLQPNQATLFTAEINLADRTGVYTLAGKMTGSGIGGGKKVTTRFYIYEIW